jgi:hypothetical protein
MKTRIVLFVLVHIVAACGPDGRQVRLCARVFAEIEGEAAARFRPAGAEALPAAAPGVALLYRETDAPGAAPLRFLCRFRGGRFERGQSELIGVTRLSGAELSLPALIHLRRRVGLD